MNPRYASLPPQRTAADKEAALVQRLTMARSIDGLTAAMLVRQTGCPLKVCEYRLQLEQTRRERVA